MVCKDLRTFGYAVAGVAWWLGVVHLLARWKYSVVKVDLVGVWWVVYSVVVQIIAQLF